MVCIVQAVKHLELVLSNWKMESRGVLRGKPFEWLASTDPTRLESIVCEILKAPNEKAFYVEQVRNAWDSHRQAELWLSQVNTLDFHEAGIEQVTTNAKLKKATQARAAAKKPRSKGKAVTVAMVADYLNARPNEKRESLTAELAERYQVSDRTIYNRLKEAKKNNLLQ